MRTDLFDYTLPEELIAQMPITRSESRLLVLHRSNGSIEHRRFTDILEYMSAGDTLVLNNTRVTARRLKALRESGQPAEVLITRPVGECAWEALVKPGKSLRPGRTVTLLSPTESVPNPVAKVIETMPDGGRILEFADTATRDQIAEWGETPLPPYIHQALSRHEEERYQTVYAKEGGSVAAPTAGLHFTPELLKQIEAKGVARAEVTLHVGVGTFRPVKAETVEEHEMHAETFHIPSHTAQTINATKGKIFAVGTTSTRTLEAVSATLSEGDARRVKPASDDTALFITPGYKFRVVDALITNFHLPRSTLLMLVSAFADRDMVLNAYQTAVQERYRFFSFGDAMLIL